MTGESLDIKSAELEKLHSLFPGLFTEGKLDWEKLKATFGDAIQFSNERYVLNWAGKADTYKVLQTPTTATLKPCPEESINFDTSENIFIEGENLEVLKILQKSYFGKIKVICIDPPYNTGNDSFVYPDKFSERKEDYLKRVGDKNEEGFLMKEGLFRKNSKDSGHFHSNWLSMMYPRLFLARNLLKDDGVIFVHIDDNEVHNLRLLMNEVFGEENFVGCFIWRKKEGGGQTDDHFVTEHEYIIVYRKTNKFIWTDFVKEDDESKYNYDDNKGKYKIIKLAKWGSAARREDRPTMHFAIVSPDGTNVYPKAPDGSEGRWRVGAKTMKDLISSDKIHWEKDSTEWIAYEKIYFDSAKGKKIKQRSVLYDIANTGDGTNLLTELFGVKDIFDNPKPLELIQVLIENHLNDDEIILDFFAGSGTVAHTILELNKDGSNRKFILVQLPEKTKETSVAFGNGFKSISKISLTRIKKVIEKINNEIDKTKVDPVIDIGVKVFKISESNFKIWQSTELSTDTLVRQLEAFTNPTIPEFNDKNLIVEIMLKSGYCLTDKILSYNNYHSIKENELIVVFNNIDHNTITEIISLKPKKAIVLDQAFSSNDQFKTNTILQLKEAGIDFKII